MHRGAIIRPILLARVTVAILVAATLVTSVSAAVATVSNDTTATSAPLPSERTDAVAPVAPTDQTKPGADAPNVSSTLLQLVDADDREAFASAHGIDLRDGRVLVVVELRGRSTVPDGYDVTVEQTATVSGETFVQARVPVDEVVPLSEEPGVAYVRLPDRAAAGGETTTPSVSSPGADSSSRQTDVLVVVAAVGAAIAAVGLYGRVRR
jgi:hypothetical protein